MSTAAKTRPDKCIAEAVDDGGGGLRGDVRFKQDPFEFFEKILKRLARLDDAPTFGHNTTAKIHVDGTATFQFDGCCSARPLWSLSHLHELPARGRSHHGQVNFRALWAGDVNSTSLFHGFLGFLLTLAPFFLLALQQLALFLGQHHRCNRFIVVPRVPIVVVRLRSERLHHRFIHVVPLVVFLRGGRG